MSDKTEDGSTLKASTLDLSLKCEESLKAEPMFGDYQLLGDSILVRFAKHILNIPSRIVNRSATIGYCVSGQRIKQLTKGIRKGGYEISKKVIILIGTNDLNCGKKADDMKRHFEKLLMILHLRKVEEFVILTLLPIPKYSLLPSHWLHLQNFNKYLLELRSQPNINVIDILPKFLKQESDMLKNPFMSHAYTGPSPKRKAEGPANKMPTKKIRSIHTLLGDDNTLNQFSKYLNKKNRIEWEDLADSSEDEGYCKSIVPYIDYLFWNRLKKSIIYEEPVKKEETSKTATPEGEKNNYQDCNLKIMELAGHFIRLDCYETYFYNQRFDLIHPNAQGLKLIETEIRKHLKMPQNNNYRYKSRYTI